MATIFNFEFEGNRKVVQSRITKKVLNAAKSRGGECKFSTNPSPRWFCHLHFKEVTEVFVGIDGRNEFTVGIKAVGGRFFPPTREAVSTGKVVPKGLPEIEKWLYDEIKEFKVTAVYRIFDGGTLPLELKCLTSAPMGPNRAI